MDVIFWLLMRQRFLERAIRRVEVIALAVRPEEAIGLLGQASPYFSPFAFDPRNIKGVVCRRLVTHPCDGGCLGSLLNGYALSSSYRTAIYGSGVVGNTRCEFFGD